MIADTVLARRLEVAKLNLQAAEYGAATSKNQPETTEIAKEVALLRLEVEKLGKAEVERELEALHTRFRALDISDGEKWLGSPAAMSKGNTSPGAQPDLESGLYRFLSDDNTHNSSTWAGLGAMDVEMQPPASPLDLFNGEGFCDTASGESTEIAKFALLAPRQVIVSRQVSMASPTPMPRNVGNNTLHPFEAAPVVRGPAARSAGTSVFSRSGSCSNAVDIDETPPSLGLEAPMAGSADAAAPLAADSFALLSGAGAGGESKYHLSTPVSWTSAKAPVRQPDTSLRRATPAAEVNSTSLSRESAPQTVESGGLSLSRVASTSFNPLARRRDVATSAVQNELGLVPLNEVAAWIQRSGIFLREFVRWSTYIYWRVEHGFDDATARKSQPCVKIAHEADRVHHCPAMSGTETVYNSSPPSEIDYPEEVEKDDPEEKVDSDPYGANSRYLREGEEAAEEGEGDAGRDEDDEDDEDDGEEDEEGGENDNDRDEDDGGRNDGDEDHEE
ncbi:hypothetical protein C8R43DRAFT_1124758 [Mycena crocata]|nr:hypothetical protein C8R43DRAFT_1124758 [Mycena crocata]